MGNNQLFHEIPPFDLVEKILKHFIPDMISFNYTFSRQDIIDKNILIKIIPYLEKLRPYYLKCKTTKYLSEINAKNIITILRQILKPYGLNIVSKEKYKNKHKFLLYSLQKIEQNNNIEYNLTMKFD